METRGNHRRKYWRIQPPFFFGGGEQLLLGEESKTMVPQNSADLAHSPLFLGIGSKSLSKKIGRSDLGTAASFGDILGF